MKSIAEVKRDVLLAGAVQRLSELNKERDVLLSIIEKHDNRKKKSDIVKHVKSLRKFNKLRSGIKRGFRYRKGTHWTQRPENKARLRKMMRKIGKQRIQNLKENK